MLRFRGLCKTFGQRAIFHNAQLDLPSGAHALQGANGSVKSTLLSLLSSALPADAGEIWIDNISLMQESLAARQRLSYVPDESPIYPFMSGRELLDFVAMAKHTDVTQDILTLTQHFGLNNHLQTRFADMSLGTQKKFMLCAAWIGDPRVLLLDEPSNGLDVEARQLLARLIQDKGQRDCILFTTHDADFVSASGAVILHMANIPGTAQAAELPLQA